VVRSIILLGSSLGKAVPAEGIETASQLAELAAMGCGFGQGYLFAPPLAPREVSARLGVTSLRERVRPAREAAIGGDVPTTMVH